ncbi:hypothetical protein J2728_000661 [Caulobacter segnis]|nr:hypothetical protein [Caulobacter segnis]
MTDFYERCIARLNARAWNRLGDFVAAEVVGALPRALTK